jgi:hypothetical protein
VVVAVFAVLTVQLAVDQIIDMADVRDRHVLAADAVLVALRVPAGRLSRSAGYHVARPDLVLVDMVAMGVVEVPVVRVVDVIVVPHRHMSAARTVLVIVSIVNE